MDVKIVKVLLKFVQKRKKQNVDLIAYYPSINGLIYKPIKWQIIKGQLSDLHNDNKSKDRIQDRKIKNELLKEITSKSLTHERVFDIVKPKTFFNNYDSMGAVNFLKKMTGSHATRHMSLYIISDNEDYQGLNIAKLFQDPKKLNKKKTKELMLNQAPIISFDDYLVENENYVSKLYKSYFYNISTCTTHDIEITSNKNNQEKKQIHNIIIKNVKSTVNNGIDPTGIIMNAFKKNLDARFKVGVGTRECLICKIKHPNMLVASHIKARSESTDISEKIDGNNGFWLCALCDRAFDRRLITFSQDRKITLSKDIKSQNIFNQEFELKEELYTESKKYLDYHLQKFKERFPSKQ